MAATVQSNPYFSISRKVGYSVGLEYLVKRVSCLVDKYDSAGSISLAEWKHIVEEDFGRRGIKSSGSLAPYEHIANFLSALNFIKIQGRDLIILPNLDAAAIIKRLAADDDSFKLGLLSLITFAVLEADGDIFTNLLEADFERVAARANLLEMISAKWDCYSRAVTTPAGLDRIWDAVSIRSQLGKPTTGPAGGGVGLRRTVSLTEALRRPAPSPQKVPEVQDSYLEGVITTRKSWARDLGLVEDNTKTARSQRLLTSLRSKGFGLANGGFALWPYDFEVVQVRLDGRSPVRADSWDLLSAVHDAFSLRSNAQCVEGEGLFDLVRSIYEAYRASSRALGMIRNQLPLYVLKPTLVAMSAASGNALPNLFDFLHAEVRDPRRRINKVSIRGTEGAITIKV